MANMLSHIKKQLGDRKLATLTFGYTSFLDSMASLTYSLAYSHLQEDEGTINGRHDLASGMEKQSFATTVAYSSMDRNWVIKGTWSHTAAESGWGKNFPVTDVYTIGVSYVFR